MTLHDRLEEMLRTALNDDTIALEDGSRFDELPDWDSVAFINFLFALEAAFGRPFDPGTLMAFDTFGGLKSYLDQQGVAA